jgi:hypothetical protein
MKKILFVMFLILIVWSCGKKEKANLDAYSPEAFAYDIGDSWEVNSTVRIKGFEQTKDENSGLYKVSISYFADLITPSDSTIKKVYEDTIHKSDSESMADIALEAQFDLDSTYKAGNYKIMYHINDNITGDTLLALVKFNLGE